jgi:RHS repeat-associated protein
MLENVWLMDLPAVVMQASANYYVSPDNLGAPRVIQDQTGAQSWTWGHGPYGSEISWPLTAFDTNLRFPGQYFDTETHLHHNGARDYSPALGRYIQSDPIGLRGGINTYTYVRNNPVNLTDPSGLSPALAIRAIIACAVDPRCAGPIVIGIGVFIHQLTHPIVLSVGEDKNATAPSGTCPAAGESKSNTNPYKGPVDEPVIVIDKNGNAIPVNEGESIGASPSGDYQQIKGPNGLPTGVRLDKGGHPNVPYPHAHVPGVTLPGGDPHLPVKSGE